MTENISAATKGRAAPYSCAGWRIALANATAISEAVMMARTVEWNIDWLSSAARRLRTGKKTLLVGVFAYLINNWNGLARINLKALRGAG